MHLSIVIIKVGLSSTIPVIKMELDSTFPYVKMGLDPIKSKTHMAALLKTTNHVLFQFTCIALLRQTDSLFCLYTVIHEIVMKLKVRRQR